MSPEKIVQTAGSEQLETFAPEFAHFNDDVLFGENWNNQDIDVKTRSIITVVRKEVRSLRGRGKEIQHGTFKVLDFGKRS